MIGKLIIAICIVVVYNTFVSSEKPTKKEVPIEAVETNTITQQQKDLLSRLIMANGYSCNRMTRVRQSSYDGSWRVFCGEESAYDIKKSNNFWKVTKKY